MTRFSERLLSQETGRQCVPTSHAAPKIPRLGRRATVACSSAALDPSFPLSANPGTIPAQPEHHRLPPSTATFSQPRPEPFLSASSSPPPAIYPSSRVLAQVRITDRFSLTKYFANITYRTYLRCPGRPSVTLVAASPFPAQRVSCISVRSCPIVDGGATCTRLQRSSSHPARSRLSRSFAANPRRLPRHRRRTGVPPIRQPGALSEGGSR